MEEKYKTYQLKLPPRYKDNFVPMLTTHFDNLMKKKIVEKYLVTADESNVLINVTISVQTIRELIDAGLPHSALINDFGFGGDAYIKEVIFGSRPIGLMAEEINEENGNA